MGRPKLDPKFKVARLEEAKKKAATLNRRLPPHVYAFARPSGEVYIRYEPAGGRKIIMRSPFPSMDFDRELIAVKEGRALSTATLQSPAVTAPVSPPTTWRWLCQEYFKCPGFLSYSERDQRVRRNLLEWTWNEPLMREEPAGAKFGNMPVQLFQTKAILTLRDRKACYVTVPDPMYPNDRGKDRKVPKTPEAASSVVNYIRLVTRWAVVHHTDLVGGRSWGHEVPTVDNPSNGHKTWGPEQCAAFETQHLPGTKPRLIYEVARRAAQRLADVVRLGSGMLGHSPKGVERLRFVQDKNHRQEPVTAFVPMTKELRQAVDDAAAAGLLGKSTWIAQKNGSPYKAESLGNDFRDYYRQAGIVGYSLHGLRKTGVVDMIMADFSFFQIMAITGHRSKKEIERYGRDYMREIAMEGAFKKWLELHREEEEVDEKILETV